MKHRTVAAVPALVAGLMLVSAPAASATPGLETSTSSGDSVATASEVCAVETAAQGGSAPVALNEHPDGDALVDQVLTEIESGEYNLNASANDLQTDQGEATSIEVEGEEVSSVTIPIAGDYGMASNLTVIFDDQGGVAEYAETLHSENAEGNVTVEAYNNGELMNSEDTDITYMTQEELQEEAQNADDEGGIAPQNTNTTACVASILGINTVLAGTVVALCGGSCAVPVTPPTAKVCAACIGGIVTIAGGTTAGLVMGCFS